MESAVSFALPSCVPRILSILQGGAGHTSLVAIESGKGMKVKVVK